MFVFRGTPLVAQLFLIYYGSGQFVPQLRAVGLWDGYFRDPMFCGLLALVLNTSAYTAEILRGAILGVPHGEIEAAKAFGMPRFLQLRRIILPRAFRIGLPAYTNEVVFLFQATSLVSLITLLRPRRRGARRDRRHLPAPSGVDLRRRRLLRHLVLLVLALRPARMALERPPAGAAGRRKKGRCAAADSGRYAPAVAEEYVVGAEGRARSWPSRAILICSRARSRNEGPEMRLPCVHFLRRQCRSLPRPASAQRERPRPGVPACSRKCARRSCRTRRRRAAGRAFGEIRDP